MIGTIIFSRFTSVTAKALSELLGVKAYRRDKVPNGIMFPILNWGCSSLPVGNFSGQIYNRSAAVSNSSNRAQNLRVLNTCCPRNHLEYMQASSWLPNTDSPFEHFVLRDRYSKWGNDIVWNPNLSRLYPDNLVSKLFVEFWPSDYEVRVHVVRDKVALMQIKKHVENGYQKSTSTNKLIRNYNNGWRLLPLTDEEADSLGIYKDALRKAAKLVISTSGLDIGAVDFLVRSDRSWKALEYNSAPALSGYTLNKVGTTIQNTFGGPIQEDRTSVMTTPVGVNEEAVVESPNRPFRTVPFMRPGGRIEIDTRSIGFDSLGRIVFLDGGNQP